MGWDGKANCYMMLLLDEGQIKDSRKDVDDISCNGFSQ